jgi:SEC-C motif domain protein
MEIVMKCPCGRGDSLASCCGPIIAGEVEPETAEDLMRARYSAFATRAMDFVIASHHPDTLSGVDQKALQDSSLGPTWVGLEVLATEDGQAGDDQGWVEFAARYRAPGHEAIMHERSLFRRHQGLWRYHSGEQPKGETARRAQPKVGRNEPCPCGSGKKYKKCCG